MIIIAGYTLSNSTEERDAAVEACAEMVARARQQDGCVDFTITADTVDATRMNVCELWRDRETLDAWRQVADPPSLEPREAAVNLYRAGNAEPPF